MMHGTIISFDQSITRPPSQYMSLAEKELFDVDTGQVIPEIVLMRSEEIRTMVSMWDINDNYPFAPPEVDQAINEEDEANVALNDDEDIEFVKELMGNFDFEAEDSNWA